jgi:hypothetical protein
MRHRVVGFTFRSFLSVTSPLRGPGQPVSTVQITSAGNPHFQLALKYMF